MATTTTKPKRPTKRTTPQASASYPLPSLGQALLCRSCVHFVPEAGDVGHPSPCLRVRWVGVKHHEPTLSRTRKGRVKCSEYQKRPGRNRPK